jgi:excisionase family DNA binding protein
MEITPLLVSIPQAAQALGRGTSTIYDLLARQEIEAVKSDGRTLIRYNSLQAYADRLPKATFAPPRNRKPQHLRRVGNSAQGQDSETQRRRESVFVGYSAQDQDRAEWVKTLAAEAADVRRQLAETHMSERERVSKNAWLQILVLFPQLTDAELKQLQCSLRFIAVNPA